MHHHHGAHAVHVLPSTQAKEPRRIDRAEWLDRPWIEHGHAADWAIVAPRVCHARRLPPGSSCRASVSSTPVHASPQGISTASAGRTHGQHTLAGEIHLDASDHRWQQARARRHCSHFTEGPGVPRFRHGGATPPKPPNTRKKPPRGPQ